MSFNINKLFSIEGKTAVVTGGSRGIGKMIAEGYVENGVKTYITARKAEACQQTSEELSKKGECIAFPADLSSKEGRQSQLLPPVHLIWVRAGDVHTTLGDALQACREDLPATLALHSGPSKSADIGQILVTGVHGPGRIIAAVLLGPRP